MLKHLFIVIFCCSLSSEMYNLSDDALLAKQFSSEEIAQLDSIRVFFNNYLLSTCKKGSNIAQCYQQFFDRLSADASAGVSYNVGLSYTRQQDLYDRIGKKLFDDIWKISTGKAPGSSSDSLISYTYAIINPQGDYMTYLKDVAQEESYFSGYIEPIVSFGNTPPSLTAGMLHNHSGLDFSNKRHQLILAIHFLTMNDKEANRPD